MGVFNVHHPEVAVVLVPGEVEELPVAVVHLAERALHLVGQSQSQAMASARQIARIFAGPTVPTKRASSLCLTVKMLQRLTQDVVFKPSSTPTSTSVGAPRSADVTAATVTV